MFIPYYIFIIIYLIILLVYFIFAFFYLYHLIRFDMFNAFAKFMLAIFIGYTLAILMITGIFLVNIDWQDGLQLFEPFALNFNIY